MLRLLRLWRLAAKDLPLIWFALRHPARPAWLWPVALFLAVYAIEPLNFAIPALGVVDDVVLLPLVIHLLVRLLPRPIQADFERPTLAP